MCTIPDFMLYYPCLEAEPGRLTPPRNAYTTVEPLDETRWRAKLTRRVMPLDPIEPRRRRPAREGLSRAGRSIRTLVRLNSRVVYQISVRQDPSVYAFTVYAAGRGLVCVGVSTVTDASQRMPAAIPPTMARARESAVLAWSFIA